MAPSLDTYDHHATVTANHRYSAHQRTYNLAIEDLHTYYVVAGDTAVLVHNDSGCGPQALAVAYRLANQVGWRKNVAAMVYDVDGISGSDVAVSGMADRVGAVGMPENPIFIADRAADSEWKLLENLAAKLNPNSAGSVNIYSERTVCSSCQSVIQQFQQRFPGVRVDVTVGE